MMPTYETQIIYKRRDNGYSGCYTVWRKMDEHQAEAWCTVNNLVYKSSTVKEYTARSA